MRSRFAFAAAAALLSVPSPPAAAAPRTHIVVMDKMKFGAMPSGLRVGDTIVWVNRDMVRHTATAKTGAFDVDLKAGAKAKTVIRSPGAIPIVCKFHPGMRTTLRVAAE
jgi:plastocyanin